MSTVETPKKPRIRKPRRNFTKEIEALEAYCSASLDILTAQPMSDFGKGGAAAFAAIIRKMGVLRGQ